MEREKYYHEVFINTYSTITYLRVLEVAELIISQPGLELLRK